MPRPKGTPKTGGRVAGQPNKTSRKINELCEANGQLKPAEYLLKMMHDDSTEEQVKIDCAKALLPYTDRKMPVSVENTDMNELEKATNEELEQRLKELE